MAAVPAAVNTVRTTGILGNDGVSDSPAQIAKTGRQLFGKSNASVVGFYDHSDHSIDRKGDTETD